jgi:hypothetical protein
MTCRREGEKYHFQKGGGGINIVFGPKYRPLKITIGIFFKNRNRSWACLLGPERTVWWKKTEVKNLMVLSLKARGLAQLLTVFLTSSWRHVKQLGRTNVTQNPRRLLLESIDGQVRLVRLQTENFRLFLRQQTDKRQTFKLSFVRWANGKQIKEKPCASVFGLKIAALFGALKVIFSDLFFFRGTLQDWKNQNEKKIWNFFSALSLSSKLKPPFFLKGLRFT